MRFYMRFSFDRRYLRALRRDGFGIFCLARRAPRLGFLRPDVEEPKQHRLFRIGNGVKTKATAGQSFFDERAAVVYKDAAVFIQFSSRESNFSQNPTAKLRLMENPPMTLKQFVFALLVFLSTTNCVFAQNFFWSTEDIHSGLVVNGDLTVNANSFGNSGRTYLYYDPQGVDIEFQLDLDFSWDGGGAAFTDARTLDFEIEIAGTPIGLRWGDFAGPAFEVTASSVTGFLAINVISGTGILTSQSNAGPGPFFDTGSTDDGFFQVGFIDWAFTPGSADSNFVLDNVILSDISGNNVKFSDLTITAVPEPNTLVLFAVGLFSAASLRRRQTTEGSSIR